MVYVLHHLHTLRILHTTITIAGPPPRIPSAASSHPYTSCLSIIEPAALSRSRKYPVQNRHSEPVFLTGSGAWALVEFLPADVDGLGICSAFQRAYNSESPVPLPRQQGSHTSRLPFTTWSILRPGFLYFTQACKYGQLELEGWILALER
jgi:hypothetical protein